MKKDKKQSLENLTDQELMDLRTLSKKEIDGIVNQGKILTPDEQKRLNKLSKKLNNK